MRSVNSLLTEYLIGRKHCVIILKLVRNRIKFIDEANTTRTDISFSGW